MITSLNANAKSPEPPLEADLITITTEEDQWSPAVAWGDGIFLVVWLNFGSVPGIYAKRLTAEGKILDPEGILISTRLNYRSFPRVAWGKDSFLVVWEDAYPESNYDIYGARIASDGKVLDPGGFPISTAPESQSLPHVAWGEEIFLVVWEDQRFYNKTKYDLYGARIDTSGNVLDPEGILISSAKNYQWHPDVAWGKNHFLVVWEDGRFIEDNGADVFGARVSQNGQIIDPEGIPIFTGVEFQSYPNVIWNGSNFFTIWLDSRNESNHPIYGARISSTGQVLEPEGIPILLVQEEYFPTVGFLTLASNGSSFLAIWEDYRSHETCDITTQGPFYCPDIYGSMITTDGFVVNPEGMKIFRETFPKVSGEFFPAIAWGKDHFFVVWEQVYTPQRDDYKIKISGILLKFLDQDQDGVQDHEDNCPSDFNPDQSDSNNDGVGDVCSFMETGSDDSSIESGSDDSSGGSENRESSEESDPKSDESFNGDSSENSEETCGSCQVATARGIEAFFWLSGMILWYVGRTLKKGGYQ